MLDYPQFTGTGTAWPPYFPDLSPCDFFLCALKGAVYRNNPTALDEPLNSAVCDSVEELQDMLSTFIVRLRHLILFRMVNILKKLYCDCKNCFTLLFILFYLFIYLFLDFFQKKRYQRRAPSVNDFRN